jgi:hypothetical protein
MGGETSSNRDSRKAGSALPTSGPRLLQQQSQNRFFRCGRECPAAGAAPKPHLFGRGRERDAEAVRRSLSLN